MFFTCPGAMCLYTSSEGSLSAKLFTAVTMKKFLPPFKITVAFVAVATVIAGIATVAVVAVVAVDTVVTIYKAFTTFF